VKPGTELDEKARSAKIYLRTVDRVIPMLPASLSNELCSLNQT